MSWETPSCRMETFESSPGRLSQPYVALSYAWGDLQAPKECIKLNGQIFEVTKTLYDFLCFFRNSLVNEETRPWIWIDQICINQLDNSERSHTVSFMSDIYREATFVVAWLGYDLWSTRNAQRLGPLSRDGLLLLQPILNNPYFTRLWIVQEVILAREVHFVSGHIWLPLHDLPQYRFCRAQNFLSEIPTTSLDLLSNKDNQRKQLAIDPTYQRHEDFRFSIINYCDNVCSDPRDKVYALMGFVEVEYQVPIDYSKTVEQVFHDAFQILWRDWLTDNENNLAFTAYTVLRLAKSMLPLSPYIVFVKMMRARLRHLERKRNDSDVIRYVFMFRDRYSVLTSD
ncbi:heterokaryon incompatibility protein-domain-containing protein [Paraphoma chrysanthemicola]|uniref:Heterokaryon incompatibility protein-domain-containing protein n=1 Tax=Paraphoma chrysanthemicola TaxID=798071 RepID=A0A8K0R099_9PLEO|nr:heterokaryon incompatibility protein-domain-containing protein [Paraphoma chrysanthemicola]